MSEIDVFQAAWARAWADLGAAGDGADLRDALLAAYAEPHRRYHTQQHLGECLAALDTARHLARHPGEVAIALWFHDAVYDLQAHDNEQRSADRAAAALQAAGVSAEAVDRVVALILATRHTAVPATPDEQLLVDIDLGILGAAPARFAEYERQIREEYAFAPEAIFCSARRGILQGFLARPVLYGTAHFHDRLEARARANLAGVLA